MKEFFKDYKTLFAAVWEGVIHPDVLYDYFRGTIDFKDVLIEFEFYKDYKEEMDKIITLNELTNFVRTNDLFNLWKEWGV